MKYDRIAGIPENPESYASSELRALWTVWLEKQDELENSGAFQDFLKKMQREWAIETGIIERLYTWDRGVTEVLIQQGIDSSLIAHKGGIQREKAEHIKRIIDDQLSIVEGLFSFVKGEQPLTEHFIRGLQAQFTEHQDYTEALAADGTLLRVALEKGQYKTLPNNPKRPDGLVHAYCPPELAQEEMSRLVGWYREAEDTVPTEIKAAWLHHRFTQIHPFQDGNGRVARALASLVFLKDRYFPLVIRDSDRKEYIGALELADDGDLRPLVNLFSRRQKEAILRALGLEQQVQQSNHAEQIMLSTLQVLKDKHDGEHKRFAQVYGYADDLFLIAKERLDLFTQKLDNALMEVTPPNQERYRAYLHSADNESDRKHYFYHQIVDTAQKFDYFANLERYRAWLRISIRTNEIFEFVVSLHGYGYGETGIMAASAFTDRRVDKEGGGTETIGTQPASIDLFQFNYAESRESTEERFREWLESALAIAMAEWNRMMTA